MEPFDHLVILIIAVLLVALEEALILVQKLRHALAVGDDVIGNLGSVGVDEILDLVERGSGGVELVDGFLLLLIFAAAGQADKQSQHQNDGYDGFQVLFHDFSLFLYFYFLINDFRTRWS